MIGNLFLDTSKVVKLTRPLSYEYDTETQSVVLLDGYEYTVAYKRASRNLAQTIDLRLPKVAGVCSINNPGSFSLDADGTVTICLGTTGSIITGTDSGDVE